MSDNKGCGLPPATPAFSHFSKRSRYFVDGGRYRKPRRLFIRYACEEEGGGPLDQPYVRKPRGRGKSPRFYHALGAEQLTQRQ